MAVAAAALLLFSLGFPNRAVASRYPVRGIDVSNHQGNIDWREVASSGNVHFAYIKATEGADFQDAAFSANWKAAGQAGVVRGAYHYFKTGSTGSDQAANFLSVAPVEKGCLSPVVDIEEGGLQKAQFNKELGDFVFAIEAQYGCKPILYVTYPLYNEYIKGGFSGCPIWIRDVFMPPTLSRDEWLFWQYSDSGRIPGIDGAVDLDVFGGSEEEFVAQLIS